MNKVLTFLLTFIYSILLAWIAIHLSLDRSDFSFYSLGYDRLIVYEQFEHICFSDSPFVCLSSGISKSLALTSPFFLPFALYIQTSLYSSLFLYSLANPGRLKIKKIVLLYIILTPILLVQVFPSLYILKQLFSVSFFSLFIAFSGSYSLYRSSISFCLALISAFFTVFAHWISLFVFLIWFLTIQLNSKSLLLKSKLSPKGYPLGNLIAIRRPRLIKVPMLHISYFFLFVLIALVFMQIGYLDIIYSKFSTYFELIQNNSLSREGLFLFFLHCILILLTLKLFLPLSRQYSNPYSLFFVFLLAIGMVSPPLNRLYLFILMPFYIFAILPLISSIRLRKEPRYSFAQLFDVSLIISFVLYYLVQFWYLSK